MMEQLRKFFWLLLGCGIAATVGWFAYSHIFAALEPRINSKILFWLSGLIITSVAIDRIRETTVESLNSGVLEEKTRRDLKLKVDNLLSEMAKRRMVSFVVLIISAILGVILDSVERPVTTYFDLIGNFGYALLFVGILNTLVVLHEQHWLTSLAGEIKSREIAAETRQEALQDLGAR